jgi:MFS family permease
MTALRFVIAMCAAEVFGMLSIGTFQALIPEFQALWAIDNTDAGWISGIYFAGYVGAVPLLSSLTDRIDPKKIMLASLALGGAASLAFALFAEGFWSALILRALQGVGLAGTYMPGLKALSDQVEGPRQSRYVAFYTASFGIGTGLSYLLAGAIAPDYGWGWAFGVNAIGAALAAILILIILPWAKARAATPEHHFLDFRPVLRNRPAMGYILAYCGHNWELFAFRSWAVAFLVFALAQNPGSGFGIDATVIAAAATLLGVPSSVFGNELAARYGRRPVIMAISGRAVSSLWDPVDRRFRCYHCGHRGHCEGRRTRGDARHARDDRFCRRHFRAALRRYCFGCGWWAVGAGLVHRLRHHGRR